MLFPRRYARRYLLFEDPFVATATPWIMLEKATTLQLEL
jgi:hypothetical protein